MNDDRRASDLFFFFFYLHLPDSVWLDENWRHEVALNILGPPLSPVCSLCLTLSDPMDCSPPGSSVHRIFQARTLEWAAISSSRDLPNPGIEPCPLHLLYWQADSLPLGAIWEEPPLYLPKWGQGSWSFCSISKSHLADFNLICPLEGADLP